MSISTYFFLSSVPNILHCRFSRCQRCAYGNKHAYNKLRTKSQKRLNVMKKQGKSSIFFHFSAFCIIINNSWLFLYLSLLSLLPFLLLLYIHSSCGYFLIDIFLALSRHVPSLMLFILMPNNSSSKMTFFFLCLHPSWLFGSRVVFHIF